jgi:twitching motility protein PilT
MAAADPSLQALDRNRVEQILRAAVKGGVSDVHFKAGEPVLLRVQGRLQALNSPKLRPEDTQRVFESLRPAHLAASDPESLREMDFSYAMAGVGRFRVNVFRQRGSVALVIRVIPLDVPELKELNLPETLQQLSMEERGMILVTGATGSGKSTTLAAMINLINHTKTSHVITIEDPIEFFFRNKKSSIVQREIGFDTNGFAVALRAALRQDPDVIMIGEMRDTETIDIALKAAETGHLVLSTAHTTDAARTLQRLISVFPTFEQPMVRIRLAETLRAVVSQRLLPRADGRGLIPASEVMVATRVIQDCMRHGERTQQIQEFIAQGRHYGMQTFDQSLLTLLRQNLITREVALGAATSPGDLDLAIRLGVEADDDPSIERHNYGDQVDDQELELARIRTGDTAAPPAPAAPPPTPARS